MVFLPDTFENVSFVGIFEVCVAVKCGTLSWLKSFGLARCTERGALDWTFVRGFVDLLATGFLNGVVLPTRSDFDEPDGRTGLVGLRTAGLADDADLGRLCEPAWGPKGTTLLETFAGDFCRGVVASAAMTRRNKPSP